jgi:hypothetical protein
MIMREEAKWAASWGLGQRREQKTKEEEEERKKESERFFALAPSLAE